MQPVKLNYKIFQGSTFQQAYRWESETKVYVPIQTIQKSAPCIITTSEPHNLPVGWRFRVVGAGGMKEINSPCDSFYLASNTTGSSININQINSLNYSTYTSGGVVEYNQPVPLTGYGARMQIRETVESTDVLYSTSSENGDINLDLNTSTISLNIPANITQTFKFTCAVYSIELYDNTGIVISFLTGNLILIPEVTR
jgi:hypothetical protein